MRGHGGQDSIPFGQSLWPGATGVPDWLLQVTASGRGLLAAALLSGSLALPDPSSLSSLCLVPHLSGRAVALSLEQGPLHG